jgi:hypothetical protein
MNKLKNDLKARGHGLNDQATASEIPAIWHIQNTDIQYVTCLTRGIELTLGTEACLPTLRTFSL